MEDKHKCTHKRMGAFIRSRIAMHHQCGIQEGQANLCLVGSSCTLQRARIETNLPRKRGAAAAGYDKSLESFFRKVGNGHSSFSCQCLLWGIHIAWHQVHYSYPMYFRVCKQVVHGGG